MENDDVIAVARDQSLQYDHRQLVAYQSSLARHYDTRVQIIATLSSHRKCAGGEERARTSAAPIRWLAANGRRAVVFVVTRTT